MVPIRIMMLTENPLYGGITTYLLNVAAALKDDDRFELFLTSLPAWEGDPVLIKGAAKLGHQVHVFPMAGTFDIRVLAKLREYVSRERIDIVHTHGYRSTLIAYAARLNVKCVNTCHGIIVDPTSRLRLWQWAALRAMKRHRRTIACSDYVRQWLLTEGLDARRVHTIRNGCPPPPDDADLSLRAAFEEIDHPFIAVYVGRLVSGKGVEIFLEALAELNGITAIIVGDGPLRDELKDKAEGHGVQARFVGRVDDPGKYYDAADVVVLPSNMEALPMTLIEAASRGIPAIASLVGGIPEVVYDGITGMLIPPNDVESLSRALHYLQENPDRCKDMGVEAKERWLKNFSLEPLGAQLAQTYLDTMESAE